MSLPRLDTVRWRVIELAGRLNVPETLLPTFGYSEDGARPHVDVDQRGLHYVVIERGQEQSRFTTLDLDELLLQVFSDVTFSLATQYELLHRVENQDSRRTGFAKQIELLTAISPDWAQREARKHQQILQRFPFDDWSSARAQLTSDLRGSGYSDQEAWRMACEKYPLPQ